MKRGIETIIIFSLAISPFLVSAQAATNTQSASILLAQTQEVENIQQSIQEASEQIEQLEEEIAENEIILDVLVNAKETLADAVADLNYSEKKLVGEINKTEGKIEETQEEVAELSTEIEQLKLAVDVNKLYIRQMLQVIHREQETDMWEALFVHSTLSEFLDGISRLERTGDVLRENLVEMEDRKEDLLVTTNRKELARIRLEQEKEELDDQKTVVEITKQQKASLLSQTKNQESSYQASLQEKLEAKRAFEEAIANLENQLKIVLNEDAIQDALIGLFSWPFDGWYRITQYFGNTSYARGGAYNGRGHSGVDFGTPMGTPILAVMDGVVTAADDTGASGGYDSRGVYHQCISYGKWIVIDHENGLSTRVSHLSLIKVKDGDRVQRGQIIGYTGNTGISTGPHLHLSVMATQGVEIKRLGDVITTNYCKNARAPITAGNAYLDPFEYLPRPLITVAEAEYGQTNNNVRNLQMMLKHERIFPIEVSASGVYGPTTAKAVLEWQKKYGVSEGGDGKTFGPRSVAKYDSFF